MPLNWRNEVAGSCPFYGCIDETPRREPINYSPSERDDFVGQWTCPKSTMRKKEYPPSYPCLQFKACVKLLM